jgi:hypothetical protein
VSKYGNLFLTFFQVYGTKNLRVVDLSIVPLHFGSHSQSKFGGIYITMIRVTDHAWCVGVGVAYGIGEIGMWFSLSRH